MAYTITARVFQSNPTRFAHVVEQTCSKNGIWSECKGAYVFSTTTSGPSGTLRFLQANGEYFLVALGVLNYKRWCDVKTGLNPDDATGMYVHPKYYEEGTDENKMMWKQLSEYDVKSAQGTNYTVKYSVAEGNDLVADIFIQ